MVDDNLETEEMRKARRNLCDQLESKVEELKRMIEPKVVTPERLKELVDEIPKHFKCFGRDVYNAFPNPITNALKDEPTTFAMGVRVDEVVAFIASRIGIT